MTLQRRVLGYLALAALTSCALTVGVAVLLVRHQVATQRMTALEAEANVVATTGGAPGALGAGDHVYRTGTGRAKRVGTARAAAVLAAIGAGGDAQGQISAGGRTLLYVARATPAGRVVLIRPATLPFAEWRPFLGSLALAGLGGALLALVLSYLLARRLTRPIGELAGATRQVAEGHPGVSVPVKGDDELSELGRSFNAMAAELERARESQRRFVESVSHELKTPLTSIRGYAEALEEGAVPAADAARVIAAESDRLSRLVADLLDLARVGRAGFSVSSAPLDLASVAEHAMARHLPRARELSVELSSSAAGDPQALGDEDRLLQVISNLIENALRLTPASGRVEVHVAPGEIVVRDTGPGLSAEDLPHAFERFYLHDHYRGRREVGSGLGLAIVKELVAAMEGSVDASSPAEGGAEFIVRLPTGSRLPEHVAL